MKVSVIIPNYNHAVYLPQRIESVLQQQYDDLELIVLDDCSTDTSREVIAAYAAQDARITFVINKQNSGSVFKQWAKGLSMAKGQYVWIAESDDYAETDFLATLVPVLEQNKSLAFAYTNSLIVNEKNEELGLISDLKKDLFKSTHWDYDFVTSGKQELNQYLSLQCTINNASAVLFRRSSIDAVGGIDTSFRYTGDWLMYIKLSLHGGIAYHARCLNNYREHQLNASKQSIKTGLQLFERQRCFAFIYKSKQISEESVAAMMVQAGTEYLELFYLLIKVRKEPLIMLQMITQLTKTSFSYYSQVQLHAIRKTTLWKHLFWR